jgi:tellurite resistance-related uncharacterized protein
MMRIATTLPDGLVCYKTTQDFTRRTIPPALLRAHKVKADVWGLLRVLQGRIRYCLDGENVDCTLIETGGTVVIEPDTPHYVELPDEDSRFNIAFYRARADA